VGSSGYFQDGKPVHRRSFCAFLDILGFSESIIEAHKAATSDELLQSFHEIFSAHVKDFEAKAKDDLLFFKTFSDNMLFAYPAFSDDMESEFQLVLDALVSYQYQMACAGHFIRGGLSLGPLFVDENQVFGHALLEAYHLESKVAVYPMVLLSKEAREKIDEHVGYYAEHGAPHLKALLKGPDGQYFVNYLNEAVNDFQHPSVLDVEGLDRHRDHIEKALMKFQGNAHVFAKYAWLASYHNHFCDSVSHLPRYVVDLKVSATLASLQFKQIDA
jgi:hypothetical protein